MKNQRIELATTDFSDCVMCVRSTYRKRMYGCGMWLDHQQSTRCCLFKVIHYLLQHFFVGRSHATQTKNQVNFINITWFAALFLLIQWKGKKRSHFERNKLLIMHGEHQHGLFTYKILCSMFHQLMNIFRFRFLQCLGDEEFEMQKRQKLDVKSARCGIWCVISIFYVKPEWHTTCHIVKNCWHL